MRLTRQYEKDCASCSYAIFSIVNPSAGFIVTAVSKRWYSLLQLAINRFIYIRQYRITIVKKLAVIIPIYFLQLNAAWQTLCQAPFSLYLSQYGTIIHADGEHLRRNAQEVSSSPLMS